MECRERWPETPRFRSINGEEALGAGKVVTVVSSIGTD